MALELQPLHSTQTEAIEWAMSIGQAGTGMKDAAILNKLQLKADEAGILHVGCGDGTFAIAANRVLSAMTPTPAKIVGITHCEHLLDMANNGLQNEAIRNAGIRNNVQFCCMDAFGFWSRQNINMIQALFPRGISTIVAIDVFENINNPQTQHAIRDLTALLIRGGRVILSLPYQPICWSAANFVRRSAPVPQLVGVINLAPPQFTRYAVEQVIRRCQRIAGTGSTGTLVAIRNLECEWLGDTWKTFIRCITHNIPRGVPVNDVAWFDPVHNHFYNVAEPELRYGNSGLAYCHESIGAVMEYMDRPRGHQRNIDWMDQTEADLNQQVFNGHGLWCLEQLFQRWITVHSILDPPGDAPGAWRAARMMIRDSAATIVEPHNLEQWDEFYLTPACVLVEFYRA